MRSFVKKSLQILALTLPLLASGCISHAVRVEPITLAPIQMTIDLNVHGDRSGSVTPTAEDGAPSSGSEAARTTAEE